MSKVSKNTITLNEQYEIDKEMAELMEFCTHERYKDFFLNRFKRRIIAFPLADKKYEIYLWNKKNKYYERIMNAKTIEQEIIKLVHKVWTPIYLKIKHDAEIANYNKDKEDPKTIQKANELEYLKKISQEGN